jgi:alanine racemase
VATVEEGAALRSALGPGPTIFVLGGLSPGDAANCLRHGLVPCLNDGRQLADFAATMPGHPCAIHLDTGMSRLGMEPANFTEAADAIARLGPALAISHLARADEPDHPMNARQAAAFAAATARIPGVRRSLSATGGLLLGPGFHHDLTRPGIGLYGGLPFAGARPVVSLALPVLQVRDVAPGESVGYGATWIARRPSRIATLGAGYADGLMRALAGSAVSLFAGGHAYPLVGRVSMDLVTVDVTDAAEVPDHLEILNERQTIDDLARAAGTIGYEILTSLGDRYERVYKEPRPRPDPE